jgi:hypothetical protein
MQAIRDAFPTLNFAVELDSLLASIKALLMPIVDTLNDFMSAVNDALDEMVCCGLSPYEQGFLEVTTNVIDMSTCLADSLVNSLKDLLQDILPNLGSFDGISLTIDVSSYHLEGFHFDRVMCELTLLEMSHTDETFEIEIPGVILKTFLLVREMEGKR